jgi:hypothetical protein
MRLRGERLDARRQGLARRVEPEDLIDGLSRSLEPVDREPRRGGHARRPALRGRLDPSARPSAPALEPSEGEQDEGYDERSPP